jgi:hypothetical protein
MNREEYMREKAQADFINELTFEVKEKQEKHLNKLKEGIEIFMDDITENNGILTADEYFWELSYKFTSKDYEIVEEKLMDHIKYYTQLLKESEEEKESQIF